MNIRIGLAGTFLALCTASANAQSISGTWRTEATSEGHLEVVMAPCGSAICGTIDRAIDPNGNPSSYPHIGRQMIWDMKPDGANNWSDGKIWDPRRDRTFSSKMELQGDLLKVSGCFFGICEGQDWQRVE